MQLTLYKNFKKRINSTKRPSGGTTQEVYLKQDTSLKNPTFILEDVDLDVNYCKYAGHYYYVTDITLNMYDQYELVCSMDDLASHRSEIGSTTAFIERAASAHDGTLIDTLFPSKAEDIVIQHSILTPFNPIMEDTDLCVVYSVTGDNDYGWFGANSYFVTTQIGFENILHDLFTDSGFDGIFKSSSNPIQYINSCMYYPFVVRQPGGNTVPVYLGDWHGDSVTGHPIPSRVKRLYDSTNTYRIQLERHPDIENRPWLARYPYTKYHIHFEPFGSFDLDPNMIPDDCTELVYRIDVDYVSGRGVLAVYADNVTNGILLLRTEAQIGVPIQIAQMTRMDLNDVANIVGGVAGVAGSVISQNYVAAGTMLAQTVASAVNSAIPTLSKQGTDGSVVSYYQPAYIEAVFADVVEDDNERFGRPLMQHRQISTLSGYIQCINASVNMAGLESDKVTINNYLNSGFYYE